MNVLSCLGKIRIHKQVKKLISKQYLMRRKMYVIKKEIFAVPYAVILEKRLGALEEGSG